MPVYNTNESIEGKKVHVDSRDPLRFQRTRKIEGKDYYIFKAAFNVHAEILADMPLDATKIEPNALIRLGERLGCDTAAITSASRNFSSALKSNFTATHSANAWVFAGQTNIKVITPRQEIIHAIQKRGN